MRIARPDARRLPCFVHWRARLLHATLCMSVGLALALGTHLRATAADRAASAPPTVLRCFPSGPIYDFRWKLLELALHHSAKPGEAVPRLEPVGDNNSQSRAVMQLETGALDVVALGVNDERTAKLLPVKVDILKGIIGYRLFIIRADHQPRFDKLSDAELRNDIRFGLNGQWADLPVMRANGLKVETGTGYDSLFAMLDAGRFDAFPRGLNEAYREIALQHQAHPGLVVERTRALYFPYPVYFWVNPRNTALAQRIERGLKAALADGSFRALFESHHAMEIAQLAREPRNVLRLRNPFLKSAREYPDTSWWWRP